MKCNIFFLYILSALLALASCKKDFLDKTPDEDLTIDSVFMQRPYAESFLTNIYSYLPQEMNLGNDWGYNPFVAASDEMDEPYYNAFGNAINSGSWNPVSNPNNPTPNIWANEYEGIRAANIFLENVQKVPMNEEDRKRWIGEAIFLRAFFHFWIMRVYGPIPILDHSLPTDADFNKIKRQPLEACADFIAHSCDTAAGLLPMKVTPDKYGKVTKAAALALKARLLLYMASPLWNGNPAYANFTDKDGVHLFPEEYNKEKWQKAADAAKDCIDQCEAAGYKLYVSPDGDPMHSYQDLFLVRNNSEVLFTRQEGVFTQLEFIAAPNGMGGWSGLCPTQEMVDAYEMSDGKAPILGYNSDGSPVINPASGYVEKGYTAEGSPRGYYPAGISNMYAKREPRFYASINYNGAEWRGRQIEFYKTGLDARKGGPDYTTTGYLMKKFLDPTVNIPQGRFTLKTWIFFRLGEQYLNYAEALNEAQGPVPDVYKYVNAIRNRAGLPSLSAGLSQDEMRQKIHHERRIELAFETERYFDTRRWKIAEETASGPVYGMNIAAGTSLQDNSFYQRTFVEDRVFISPKHYLWPIPQNEIDKNPNLVQNPGW